MNAIEHEFVDVHAARAPFSLGELIDGAPNSPGSSFGHLGGLDPTDPVATSDGREVAP